MNGKCDSQLLPTVVPTAVKDGRKRVKLMVLGGEPTWEDDDSGMVFSGESGDVTRRIVLDNVPYHPDEIVWSKVVRCNVGDRNVQLRSVYNACVHHTISDIQKLKPERILYVGSHRFGKLIDRNYRRGRHTRFKLESRRSDLGKVCKPVSIRGVGTYAAEDAFVASKGKVNLAMFDLIKNDAKRLTARGRKDRSGPIDSKVLDTIPKLKRFVRHCLTKLGPSDSIAFDWETGSATVPGLARRNTAPICISFSFGENRGYVVPLEHRDTPWGPEEYAKVKALLKRLFTDKRARFARWVAHNLKFDWHVAYDYLGVKQFNAKAVCTAAGEYSVNENRLMLKQVLKSEGLKEKGNPQAKGGYSLKTLAECRLDYYGYDEEAAALSHVKAGEAWRAELADLLKYAAVDTGVTLRLFNSQGDEMKEKGHYRKWLKLNEELMGRGIYLLLRLEQSGVPVNLRYLRELLADDSPLITRQRDVLEEIHARPEVQLANKVLIRKSKMRGMRNPPWVWDVSKPAHKRLLFFGVCKLKPVSFTKTGTGSIDASFKDRYSDHEVVALVSEWQNLTDLQSKYLAGWYDLLTGSLDKEGRVRHDCWDCSDNSLHPSFFYYSTNTGRLSARKPSFQNIPKGKTPSAKLVKNLVEARWRDGYVLVAIDFSQAEVRWLAQMAGDKALAAGFHKSKAVLDAFIANPTKEAAERVLLECDVHKQTAALMFEVPIGEVTKDMRQAAKSIVFGIIYGQGIKALCRAIKKDPDVEEDLKATKELRGKFMSRFTLSEAWLENQQRIARSEHEVTSPFGRIRHFLASYISGVTLWGDEKEQESFNKNQAYEDRAARNAPIQATASDGNWYCAAVLQEYIDRHGYDWNLFGLIHDSILAEVPLKEARKYVDVACGLMTDPRIFERDFGIKLIVPMQVDAEVGISWGELIGCITTNPKNGHIIRYSDGEKDHDLWFDSRKEMIQYAKGMEKLPDEAHIDAILARLHVEMKRRKARLEA